MKWITRERPKIDRVACQMTLSLFVPLLFASSAFSATPKEVVIYTSVDDVFARPIAERFERETGIKAKLVPDTEETKSTGLVNRLIAEKDRPQADVFWSGDPVRAALLKSRDVAAPHVSRQTRGLPKEFSDAKGYWTGFSSRARIILINTNLIPTGREPTSVKDLVDPKFQGNGCLANPLFGTTSMHAAALFEVMGEKAARELFDGMLRNDVKVLSSNGEVRRRVSAGDCAFGLTDTDDAFGAVREGKPVGVVYPDSGGMGTLLVPNAAVLIARAPHPEAAKVFIDFLVSPEIEAALAASDAAQMPLRKGVKTPVHVKSIGQIKAMKVNYAKLAKRLDDLSRGYLKDWVEKAASR